MAKPLLALLVAAGLAISAGAARGATLTIACAAVGIEFELCRDGAEAWAAESGHAVELIQTPSLANERLALFQQLLASRSADIDVLQIDVIWPGILAAHLLDLGAYVDEAEIEGHFPAMIANYRVAGALKALPWYADAGLLYYRRDLLDKHGFAVPETWAELERAGRAIVAAERAAGDARLVGYVFQGKAYEGLTCNALEWIASAGGAPILGADGKVALDDPRGIAALDAAAGWIGGLAPRGVLTYAEEEARGVFQSGRAVFMRNWPYAWALADAPDSPVRGKVGVAPLPRHGADGRHVGALGGGGLAVSAYSKHPEAAADLVGYLTGSAEQLRRAIVAAFNPTRPALFEDARLHAAQPFMAALLPVLSEAVSRPAPVAGTRYNRLSHIFWNAVHDTLSGHGGAAENLGAAQRRLARLARRGRW